MTRQEHCERHAMLHRALDELAADWVAQQPRGKMFSNSTIMELMEWSYRQTVNPECPPRCSHLIPDYPEKA